MTSGLKIVCRRLEKAEGAVLFVMQGSAVSCDISIVQSLSAKRQACRFLRESAGA